MAEIDSLGSNVYYSGIQSAGSQALKKNKKAQNIKSTKKTKFSDLIHKTENKEQEFNTNGLPSEIATMTIEDAAIFLKDNVDNAGNFLAEEVTKENIENFKTAVQQFLRFMVINNYSVSSRQKRNAFGRVKMVPSQGNFFSNYQLPPHEINPKYQINIINEKLAALTAATLEGQKNNMELLAQINEIKGLLIDLMK